MTEIQEASKVARERRVTKRSRDYWYGRSRANEWPLWVSWLLAPDDRARCRVSTEMYMRRRR